MLDRKVLETVRCSLETASGNKGQGIWKTYDILIQEHGFNWEMLAAISIISAEMCHKYISRGMDDKAAVFQAMNEMVFDYAAGHTEEIDNYMLFKENSSHWIEAIPTY